MEAYGQVKGRRFPSIHGGTTEPGYVRCKACGDVLARDRFKLRNGRVKQPCIACITKRKEEAKRAEQAAREKILESGPSTKVCGRCGKEKPASEYTIRLGRLNYWCTECSREYHRERYKRDKEKRA